MRSLRAFRMTHGNQRLLQQLLKIGLANVDDVVDVRRTAVVRVLSNAVRAARRPQRTLRPLRENPEFSANLTVSITPKVV